MRGAQEFDVVICQQEHVQFIFPFLSFHFGYFECFKQGPVLSFDFTIGLRPKRWRFLVFDTILGYSCTKQLGKFFHRVLIQGIDYLEGRSFLWLRLSWQYNGGSLYVVRGCFVNFYGFDPWGSAALHENIFLLNAFIDVWCILTNLTEHSAMVIASGLRCRSCKGSCFHIF